MAIKLSYSSWSKYLQCPKKYYYYKVKGLESTEIQSPLIFGSALDKALNRLLEDKKDSKSTDAYKYKFSFDREWIKHRHNSKVTFGKKDFIAEVLTDKDKERSTGTEDLTWHSMRRKAHLMIDAYIEQLLPKIKEVVQVQKSLELTNSEGDAIIGVIDFVAVLEDGNTYICDNKTSADKYKDNKAQFSEQLALYSQVMDIGNVAFFVVTKSYPVETQVVIGNPSGMFKELLVDSFVETIHGIKNDVFPANTTACFSFGRPCEYRDICFKKDYSKVVKKNG